MDDATCEAVTLKCIRCRDRRVTYGNSCRYCYAHWVDAYQQSAHTDRVPEPWDILPFNIVPRQPTQELRMLLLQGPEPVDSAGYVSIYKHEFDTAYTDDPWYMVDFDCSHIKPSRYTLGCKRVTYYKVKHARFAKDIVYSWLQYVRARRIGMFKQLPYYKMQNSPKRYVSVWYNGAYVNNETKPRFTIVPDWVSHGYHSNCYNVRSWLPQDMYPIMERNYITDNDTTFYPMIQHRSMYPVNSKWFYCPLDELKKVLGRIQHVVNHFKPSHTKMVHV